MAELEKNFPHEPIRSSAFTLEQRRTFVESLEPAAQGGNLHALMWIALATVMGAGMTRMGEVRISRPPTSPRARLRIPPSAMPSRRP